MSKLDELGGLAETKAFDAERRENHKGVTDIDYIDAFIEKEAMIRAAKCGLRDDELKELKDLLKSLREPWRR